MTQTPQRRGRPPVYDPARIASLLDERERTGESYAHLSERSGIPTGTLQRHASRRRSRGASARPSYVELVPTPKGQDIENPLRACELKLVLSHSSAVRELVIPDDIDPARLAQILTAIESAC